MPPSPTDPSGVTTALPFSKVPPEIRTLIYSFVVTQPAPLLISAKGFTARSHPRGLFPDHCMHCHTSPLSACICYLYPPPTEFYYAPFPAPTRTISTTLLHTCRLIYEEAAPLLYRENTFHFADPKAVDLFRESVDQQHVKQVEKLMLTLHSVRRGTDYQWENYVYGESRQRGKLHLRTDFPKLKSVVVRLRGNLELTPAPQIYSLCTGIASHLPPLEWIHIDGLTALDGISALHPIVSGAAAMSEANKGTSADDTVAEGSTRTTTKEVRMASYPVWARKGWGNVTLWWGQKADKSPYAPEDETGGRVSVRQILQLERNLPTGMERFRVKEKRVPCAGGVGGTKGSFGLL